MPDQPEHVNLGQRVSDWPIPERHDPLGILAASRGVLATARHVTVDARAVARFVDSIDPDQAPPAWDDGSHWREGKAETVAWVFVLDTLNFCFWGPGPGNGPRWRVRQGEGLVDGYRALVAALRRAMGEGVRLTDPGWLASVSADEVASLLRPDRGDDGNAVEIPLLPERGATLRELGTGWLTWAAAHPNDSVHPALSMVQASDGSATALVRLVTRTFASFDDVAALDGATIPFHKRAQILVGDLAGTFAGQGPGAFADLDGLTAFADYKVPQVLRRLGILRYDDALARRIAGYELIPAGSRMEIEIRAATVWGCELVRQGLITRGVNQTAVQVDWLLWEAGQHLPVGTEPYHRSPTIFY